MKNALENIRAAVLAEKMTLEQAEKEIKRFLPDMLRAPGGILRALNLPAAADRRAVIDVIMRRAELTVKHYYSDTEIDKQIINADDFCGVYAWAARECGTCLVRIGTADGLPDESGIQFFRACCLNWPGLRWYCIDALGYDVHMWQGKGSAADTLAAIDRRIVEMQELAAVRAERAAVAV